MSTSLLLLCLVAVGTDAGVTARTKDIEAERLVDLAFRAELQGDNAKRQELLQQALQLAPRSEAARWQTGHVRVGRQWLTRHQAERAVAEDPLSGRYRNKLAESYEHLSPSMAHLTLARWCRQFGLVEQERFHWIKVLERHPELPEALTALGLCHYRGEWLTQDEARARDQAAHAAQRWTRKLRELASTLERPGDTARTAAAWAKLRSISDVAAIEGLETVVAPRSETLAREVVAVLGRMPSDWAAGSLVRLTRSPFPAARTSAMAQLKQWPLDQTVPWVLAGMRWPVELEQVVLLTAWGDVIYQCEMAVEGTEARVIANLGATMIYNELPRTFVTNLARNPRPNKFVSWSAPSPAAKSAHRQATYQNYAHRAQQTEQQVAAYNVQVEDQNAAAGRLLYELTDQTLPPDPQAWLDWWTDYQEVTRVGEKPTYYVDNRQPQMVHTGPTVHVTYMSCFPRGTLIHTQAGLTPIEQIQAGDLVLAQRPDSGELAYKAVLQTTLRRPSPLVRIHVQNEAISATRGHPFWVAGRGWQMAKQLTTADRLHGLEGSWAIDRIEELPDDEAYNLVVHDFHTYFVGRQGLLVHDNTPRRPTTAVLPGYRER